MAEVKMVREPDGGQANIEKELASNNGEGSRVVLTESEDGDEKRRFVRLRQNNFARMVWNFVTWTPKRCRWDPESPPKFSMWLNLLFGFVSLSSLIV
jgi:hypothetical protein